SAFQDVSREGGISWSETFVLDDYGTKEERAAARAMDNDTHWTELLHGDAMSPAIAFGGPSFLDAIGFRYYLPVLMLKAFDDEADNNGLMFHLTLGEGEFEAYSREHWSLLDRRQRLCVKRFVRYMVEQSKEQGYGMEEEWAEVLASYWERME
ncbi:hypothetical protein MNBD_PLANCTO03-354, partial [hydrothermal vent metagenome]